jgi:hypothetical protein
MSSRAIAVVGMHRSGTSCLTGTLEEAGVYLGPVSRKNPHNLRGNHERADIMAMHDAVLAANGGAWDRPPPDVVWSAEQRATLRGIVESYAGYNLWGFKDPRTLLLLDGWLAEIPPLEFAGTFRHPLLVAQSLDRRSRRPLEQGLALWQTYNERLLALHMERGVPLIEFVADAKELRRKLGRLLDRLGLTVDAERLAFYTPELQHQREPVDATALPAEVERIYRDLQARVV